MKKYDLLKRLADREVSWIVLLDACIMLPLLLVSYFGLMLVYFKIVCDRLF